jgi:NarL family two-component system response regulator LiaR
VVKVSVIEDDKHFREGLEQLINHTTRFNVLHSYDSAEAALPHLINNPPDIAIVDIKLPGKNGIELIASIKSALPNILCMVCSYYDDNEYIFNALKNGAVGYILKDAKPNEILESLEELSQGGAPMSRYIAKKVVSVFQQKTEHKLPELSDRENEILNLVATGMHIKEAGDKLFISPMTVKCHLRNIYSKLHVTSRIEAINRLNRNNNFFQ